MDLDSVMRFDRELLSVEAERKLFHAAWALLPILYYFGFPRDGMLLLLFCEALIWLGFEAARKMGYSAFSASFKSITYFFAIADSFLAFGEF
jgi:hypothetical protein